MVKNHKLEISVQILTLKSFHGPIFHLLSCWLLSDKRTLFVIFPKERKEALVTVQRVKYSAISCFRNAKSYPSYCLSSTDRNTCN